MRDFCSNTNKQKGPSVWNEHTYTHLDSNKKNNGRVTTTENVFDFKQGLKILFTSIQTEGKGQSQQ